MFRIEKLQDPLLEICAKANENARLSVYLITEFALCLRNARGSITTLRREHCGLPKSVAYGNYLGIPIRLHLQLHLCVIATCQSPIKLIRLQRQARLKLELASILKPTAELKS